MSFSLNISGHVNGEAAAEVDQLLQDKGRELAEAIAAYGDDVSSLSAHLSSQTFSGSLLPDAEPADASGPVDSAVGEAALPEPDTEATTGAPDPEEAG